MLQPTCTPARARQACNGVQNRTPVQAALSVPAALCADHESCRIARISAATWWQQPSSQQWYNVSVIKPRHDMSLLAKRLQVPGSADLGLLHGHDPVAILAAHHSARASGSDLLLKAEFAA